MEKVHSIILIVLNAVPGILFLMVGSYALRTGGIMAVTEGIQALLVGLAFLYLAGLHTLWLLEDLRSCTPERKSP